MKRGRSFIGMLLLTIWIILMSGSMGCGKRVVVLPEDRVIKLLPPECQEYGHYGISQSYLIELHDSLDSYKECCEKK